LRRLAAFEIARQRLWQKEKCRDVACNVSKSKNAWFPRLVVAFARNAKSRLRLPGGMKPALAR